MTKLSIVGLFAAVAIAGAYTRAAAQPAPLVATPSPQSIFMRTFERLESYPVPPYVVDIDTWHVQGSVGEDRHTYRYATRTSDGMENVTKYPPFGKALPQWVVIVRQYVGPLAWLVRPIHAGDASTSQQIGPDAPQLKTIATVVAYKPGYAIELLGVEGVEGHPSYHLRLHPYRDAPTHNLRELWVDVATFDLWKAVFVGTCAPCSGPTTITSVFTPAAGTWIVDRYSFRAGCGGTDPSPCSFVLQNDAVVFVPALPDWLFDEAAYAAHAKAKEPDILAGLLGEPKH